MSSTANTTTGRRFRRGGLALALTVAVLGGGTGAAFAATHDAAPAGQVASYGDDMLPAPQVADDSQDGDAIPAPTGASYGDDMLPAPQVADTVAAGQA